MTLRGSFPMRSSGVRHQTVLARALEARREEARQWASAPRGSRHRRRPPRRGCPSRSSVRRSPPPRAHRAAREHIFDLDGIRCSRRRRRSCRRRRPSTHRSPSASRWPVIGAQTTGSAAASWRSSSATRPEELDAHCLPPPSRGSSARASTVWWRHSRRAHREVLRRVLRAIPLSRNRVR